MKFAKGLFNKFLRSDLRATGKTTAEEILKGLAERKDTPRMSDELREAKIVQETLFPPEIATVGPLKIAGYYESAVECGGDWWFYSQIGEKIYLWIGDATGHGVPAALLTSSARSVAVLMERWPGVTPALAMELLNEVVCEVTKGRLFMTFFLAAFDPRSGELEYCNASHHHPILVRGRNDGSSERSEFLSDIGTYPLGFKKGLQFHSANVQLEPDDFLFFFTDGLSDIVNPEGLQLGERRLVKLVEELAQDTTEPKAFVESLAARLFAYRGHAEIHDDITFFATRLSR